MGAFDGPYLRYWQYGFMKDLDDGSKYYAGPKEEADKLKARKKPRKNSHKRAT